MRLDDDLLGQLLTEARGRLDDLKAELIGLEPGWHRDQVLDAILRTEETIESLTDVF